MERDKEKLYVERDGFWTEAAMLLIALAVVFRAIGSIGRWEDTRYLLTQVALPAFSGLLFLLCLLLFSRRAFWTTVIPVVLGVVFFIFRAMDVENEWLRGCWILLYVVIVVLYTMTFSHPKLKWVLALVLLAVFAYHIGVQDLPRLMDLENPVSFVDGMEEMSVLGIILAMLFLSFAMKSGPKPVKGKPKAGEPGGKPPPRRSSRRGGKPGEGGKPHSRAAAQAQPEPSRPSRSLSRRECRGPEAQEPEGAGGAWPRSGRSLPRVPGPGGGADRPEAAGGLSLEDEAERKDATEDP